MNKSYLLFTIILLAVLSACSGEDDQKTLKLAHTQGESHPVHKSMEEFKNIVEKETNEDIKIKIYPDSQLGDEREYIENLETGTLDMAKVSVDSLGNFSDPWKVFSIPYVFEDQDQAVDFMDSDKVDSLYESTVDDLDVLGLTWYNGGGRNYYTKSTPIESPEDIQGLDMRVQSSDVLIESIEEMGGSGTPVDFDELYTAIQQGVVDGADNGIVAFVENNLQEVAKEFSYTEHVFSPDILLIKNSTLDDFSEEEQKIIQEAAQESTEYHEENWEKEVDKAEKTAEEEGVTIHHPDLEPFAEKLKPVKEKYIKEDKEIEEIVKEIEK